MLGPGPSSSLLQHPSCGTRATSAHPDRGHLRERWTEPHSEGHSFCHEDGLLQFSVPSCDVMPSESVSCNVSDVRGGDMAAASVPSVRVLGLGENEHYPPEHHF